MPPQLRPYLLEWEADTSYPPGLTVLDRGGLWQAIDFSKGSEPISGNPDWRLVGGTPYVDVTLDPVALTTAPVYDPTSIGPGLPVLSAPGANFSLLFMRYRTTQSLGDAWGSALNAKLWYGAPGGYDLTAAVTSNGNLQDDLSNDPAGEFLAIVSSNENAALIQPGGSNPVGVNQPIVLSSAADVTGGGATVGTRSVTYRIWYDIVPTTAPFNTFFHITAVNQGTKTFTVSPDPTSILVDGDSVTIVGSTGNDGTYTVASRDATHIVVTEAVPSATADGWVKKT